jgi:hypothetical protein
MARIYEVPFHPDAGSAWEIRVGGRVVERCESRYEALRSAVSMASHDGGETRIDVEGADGVWRPFGSDVKRPMPATQAYAVSSRAMY